ncbi:ABC transporter permease [Curtobacterium sp. DN_7.5]|uniref:ABC transporter permease n=1 Tax=Curtobacterium sp. DN_7.5 TaxID=3049047 RepID=UPI001F5A2250|nr:ABC transporter permease [Curtobacterium sp. DN_7.5]
MTAVTPTRAGSTAPVSPLAAGAAERPVRRRRGGATRRGPWLAIVYWVVIAITLVPIVSMIAYSFNDAPTNRLTFAWRGFTTYWYQNLWNVSGLGAAFGTSVAVAFLAAIVSVAIGLPLALALERYRFPGRGVVSSIVFADIAAPSIVVGSASLSFFLSIGLGTGFWTILLTHVAFDVAYVVVVLRARIAGTSKVLEEAASDLGATPLQAFRLVTLPLLAPGMLAAGLLALAMSIDDYVITSFVAGPSVTFPLFVYGAAKAGMPPQVLCFGTLVFAVGLLVALLNGALNRRLARTRG